MNFNQMSILTGPIRIGDGAVITDSCGAGIIYTNKTKVNPYSTSS
jgi:hypothetical protein